MASTVSPGHPPRPTPRDHRRYVGLYPFRTIVISVLVSVLFMSGFSQFYSESRSDKLWIPQGTEAKDEEAKYDK